MKYFERIPALVMLLALSPAASARVDARLDALLDALEAGERLTPPESRLKAPDRPSEVEPNNSFGAANPVAADGQLTGAIAERGDADWWRLNVPRRGELRIRSSRAPQGVDLSARLWNANREAVSGWASASAPGGPLEASFDLREGGGVVLELRDGRNDAASDDPYEIELAFTPVPELDEPNDAFGAAAPKPLGGAFQASILPRGDADWIAVETPDQGELHLSVAEPPDGLDLAARLWNANRETISGWVSAKATGAPLDAHFDIPRPGRHVMELRDGRDDARSVQPFEVALDFTPTKDLGEPNDSFGAAAVLPLGLPRQAAILPRGDSDWYAVTVPEQGALSIALTQVPEALDLAYRVWDGDRNTVSGWYSPLARGGDTAGVTDLRRPGRYVIEVRDGRDDARAAAPYRIQASLTPTGDRYEPNDSFGAARGLALDVEHRASILPRGDSDWYAVEASGQGALELTLTPPAGLDLAFRIWTANRDTLSGWVRPLAVGGETHGVVDLPAAGRYVVEVRDGGDDARDPAPYTLTARLSPTGDGHEPNDTFGSAAPLALGTETRAAILPKGDADWYALDIVEQGRLRIAVTGSPPGLDINWRLWNANRDTVSGWYSPLARGGDNVGAADLARPGRYVLEVRDGRDDARDPASYTLRADLAPTRDAAEPNGSFGEAHPLDLGEVVEAAILPRGDADWYRVPVPSAGRLAVEIDRAPAGLDMSFRFWDEDRSTVSGWFSAAAAGGPVSGGVDTDGPGARFIEVRDGRDDAAATERYRLKASLLAK